MHNIDNEKIQSYLLQFWW